jgi:endonuclease/exonuclease/phosphatase (EEP) superfamily protein YafD
LPEWRAWKDRTVRSSRLQWAVAGFFAAWAAARVTGADRIRWTEPVLVPLMSLTPHAAIAAGAAAVALRRPGPAVVAGAASAALGAAVLPRAFPRRQPPAEGPELRVLTVNLLRGLAAGADLAGLVRRVRPDVLFLQELTDEARARLNGGGGLADLLPYSMPDKRQHSYRGSAIYARYPLHDGLGIGPSVASQPTARLELPSGETVELVCVHPRPPFPPWISGAAPRWRAELAALPAPGGIPVILAGDYNATADHSQFRRLLRRGHRDAAIEAGRGLAPTWGPEPRGRPALLTLDHVLVDPRCAVLATAVHELPGTDHRALFAELRLPRAAG